MSQLIPAIDIIDGKCVRLTQGRYESAWVYRENPLDVAMEFEQIGFTKLHLVHLDHAADNHIASLNILDTISSRTNLQIDYGGGISNLEKLQMVLDHGADQVNCGSWPVKDPESFKEALGIYSKNIILSADVANNKIAYNAWKESSDWELMDFIDLFIPYGLLSVTCTDISRDGKLKGPAFDLYHKLIHGYPNLNITASGGVTTVKDIERLEKMDVHGIIIGKAIYEGKISFGDLGKWLNKS